MYIVFSSVQSLLVNDYWFGFIVLEIDATDDVNIIFFILYFAHNSIILIVPFTAIFKT